MANLFGFNTPDIDITGYLSSSWIYIFIVAFIGIILIVTVALVLFFRTYNRKIVVFENISGQGYQPVLKTRARIISLGIGGQEVLKTMFGNKHVSAYGRKMGNNTYWYAVGPDGFWYNVILGDLDSKMAVLDVEPIDRDVRMFHVALDRLAQNKYDKKSFMEKYGIHMMLFLFLIVLILGMWFIVGRVGDAVAPLGQANDNQAKLTETQLTITERLDNIVRNLGLKESAPAGVANSGLIPAGT